MDAYNKMKHGILKISEFPIDIYNVVEKQGGRMEYSLTLNDDLYNLGKQVSDIPLRFASIVVARPSSENQIFHSDSKNGERALIYLTDVHEPSNGPIEFKDYGKILGSKGTFVHYSANEIHRGCSSDIHRYALALAFDTSDSIITTVGDSVACEDTLFPQFYFPCPSGYTVKNPVPIKYDASPITDAMRLAYCCDINAESNSTFVVVIILAIAVFLYLFCN